VSNRLTEPERIRNVAYHVRSMMNVLGVDWDDDNFTDTPERFAKWIFPLAQPISDTEIREILSATFPEEHEELVAVMNIRFEAVCAHHLLPFSGVAHVGYLPGQKVVGISKLARLVQHCASRLTLQERMTTQIVNALTTHLKPQGAMAVVKARHACMSVRGVREPFAETVTSGVRGLFLTNENGCKDEFLRLVPDTIGGSL
jgi:GTP cyclohydrolase IA